MNVEQINGSGAAKYTKGASKGDYYDAIKPFLAKATATPLNDAFNGKFTIHAGTAAKAAAPEEIPQLFNELMAQPSQNSRAIYIHFPFCQSKCLYCGFHGRQPEETICSEYLSALKKEILWLKDQSAAHGTVRAIYLGGGTPTVMAPDKLALVVDELSRHFNLANDCEMTLEGRLHDFSPEKAKGFIDVGFNRFSIGVQSFNTDLRRSLGRISDRETVIKLLENLSSQQKAAVIIDLIYGLPGQTIDNFIDDLKIADTLNLDGLDTYQLNIFKDTPLDKALRTGQLPPAAGLNKQGNFYLEARQYLLNHRWRQLSLSHYATTYRERNIYNPWAKRRDDCLAIGAGAGGFLSGWSYFKMPNIEKYLKQAASGCFLPDALTPPAPNRYLSAFVVEQMEQGYLNVQELFDCFVANQEPLALLLNNWEENGLIIRDDNWINLTVNGLFWGVNLTQAVIEVATKNMKGTYYEQISVEA